MTKRIILFNGPPGCGKDTASEYLVDRNSWVDEYKMAKPLKEACHKLLGLPGGLKDYEHMKNEDIGALVGGEPIGMTLRAFYIHISEDVMKPLLGKLIFGTLAVTNVELLKEVVVISDSGFAPEAQPLIDKYGADKVELVRIHRPGHTFANDSRGYIDLPVTKVIDLQNDFTKEAFLEQVDKLFIEGE